MSQVESQKLCHICQDYVDHFTPNCPKLICAECDEKGHSKRNCPYLVEPEVPKENEVLNFAKQESIKEQRTSDLSDNNVAIQKNVPYGKRTNEEKVKSDQLRFRSRKIVGPNDLRYRLNWKRKGDARHRIGHSNEARIPNLDQQNSTSTVDKSGIRNEDLPFKKVFLSLKK